jgi:RyR domain/TrkA-N domain
MNQRALLTVTVIALISLGMLGQYQISTEKITGNLSTSFYEILMLFALGGEWTLELDNIPLAVEIVRVAAPLVTIASLVLVLASEAQVALANFFVRFLRSHTVVFGLNDSSYQFVKTHSGKGRMVVVEPDGENPLLDDVRRMGIHVVSGYESAENYFSRLNLHRADNCVIFTESDSENVEVALKLRGFLAGADRAASRLRLHVHLDDIGLAKQLESYPGLSGDESAVELYFFSIYDLSARLLLRDYPSEMFADAASQSRVHLAIHGYGRLAENIIVEALLLFRFKNQSKLKITIFDEDITRKKFSQEARFPLLASQCDIEHREWDYISSVGADIGLLQEVTQHIFCLDRDEHNLSQSLQLRQLLLDERNCNAPIFIRMQKTSGLAQLVHTEKGAPEIPDGIYPFGMLDEVLHTDNILSTQLDGLARTMHEMYVREATASSQQAKSWAQLSQGERKQNLLKADHWPVRLRAIRCESDTNPGPAPVFTESEVLLQARMEHDRYVTQKYLDGWTYGESRSSTAKTNPFLAPWQELPEEQQERELRDVVDQAGFLADSIGLHIKRRVVIGVTGHRLNKMNPQDEKLRKSLEESLLKIGEAHPGQNFTVLSPLAEGADRLVAEFAMDILGAKLHVPLPLPYEILISDFTDSGSVADFQALVGLAEHHFEMPMKFGGFKELAVTSADNVARNKQYALVGAYVAQRCDYLIAIHDGKPEEGVGGTAQVLRWYESGDHDPELCCPAEYFQPPEKHPAIVISP